MMRKFCDEISQKQAKIDSSLHDQQRTNSNLLREFDELKSENSRLSDELVDLQSRSMRDNLMFYNFKELSSPEERKNEKCLELIYDFCENKLGMPDFRHNVKIDHAHRVGSFSSTKTRPIVAKFNFFQDKLSVKQTAYSKQKETGIKVGDQYPKIIQERRRKLIPHLVSAKEQNKNAVLAYDKLFINGQRFIPPSN
ncbi:uncharacterized protein LOC132757881 [Ruditapes philippinarum]|uniref:uncharacterized protein LOC132757881 n=1 Tax=Ruditapes philippinarum TaxID=129788 RepID=UPI00295B082A|nr:uncharacterized protein LOC132757881 [Ruditapes philippinarum]